MTQTLIVQLGPVTDDRPAEACLAVVRAYSDSEPDAVGGIDTAGLGPITGIHVRGVDEAHVKRLSAVIRGACGDVSIAISNDR